MKQRLATIVLLLLLIASGLIFSGSERKNAKVSCEQNVGPFVNVSEPTVSKDDTRKQLIEFYEWCLRSDYSHGFVDGGNQNSNSESQAYAMWQAYLSDDKNTFDSVLNWTNSHLKRKSDNLHAWRYELERRSPFLIWEKPIFSNYRVKIVDENSATDADTDMAYVLFRAGTDWKRQRYIDQAKKMVKDIWDKETVEINGKRYVLAGNWANEPLRLVINPSYFFPQAFRTFAIYDGEHDWNKLVVDTYDLLTRISVHAEGQPAIPPNWVAISKADGSIQPYNEKSDAQDYGYDSFRVLWRVGYDQLETPNFLSWNYVSLTAPTFATDWQANQEVCALYKFANGGYACDKSTTSTLAGPIGVFSVTNGYLASQVIQKYYIRNDKLQFPDTDFYAKSWHWFGTWLWAHS